MNTNQILTQIDAIIETDVRPSLHAHGGDVEVLSVIDGICKVRLIGKCAGCASADLTTSELIEKAITTKLPAIKKVVLVQESNPELVDFAKKLLRHEI